MNLFLVNIKQRVFVSLISLLFVPAALAHNKELPSMLTLYKGQTMVVTAPNAMRIAVGDTNLLSSTLLKSGEIVITADDKGETNMLVWFPDDHRENMPILIVEDNGYRIEAELKSLLKDIPDIKIRTVGRQVVIEGDLSSRELERVNNATSRYGDVLVLAQEKNIFDEEMIYFDVKVTEFKTSDTELLGVNWSTSIPWIYGAYGRDFNATRHAAVQPIEYLPNDSSGDPFTLGREGTYWGLFTEVTSRLNFLETTGSAIILASPRLSARSGGSAELTVGGEVPVKTSSINGTSIEYKEYGIIVSISPTLDREGQIVANIETEISQVDLALSTDDAPAFLKRSTKNDITFKEGETLVLSGLISNDKQYSYNKVKWLADIPILGKLFQSKNFTGGETELVIFVTPRVMGDLKQGINQQELERAGQLVRRFVDHSESTGILDHEGGLAKEVLEQTGVPMPDPEPESE